MKNAFYSLIVFCHVYYRVSKVKVSESKQALWMNNSFDSLIVFYHVSYFAYTFSLSDIWYKYITMHISTPLHKSIYVLKLDRIQMYRINRWISDRYQNQNKICCYHNFITTNYMIDENKICNMYLIICCHLNFTQ